MPWSGLRENGLAISMTIYHQSYRQFIPLDKARAWARWLGSRYKDSGNIVWSTTPEASQEFVPVLRELAAGLHEGDGGRYLITFKPDPAPPRRPASFTTRNGWTSTRCRFGTRWRKSIRWSVRTIA